MTTKKINYDSYRDLLDCIDTNFSDDKIYSAYGLFEDNYLLTNRYHTDGVFRRIVELKPRKALIGGHTLKVISDDGETVTAASLALRTAITQWEKSIGLSNELFKALMWSRLYGGAVILIDASGRNASPLNLDDPSFVLKSITALDKSEIQAVYKDDLMSISHYIHSLTGITYHPDRVIHINGTICTRRELVQYGGFSISVLNGVEPSLKHRDQLLKGISELVRVMGTKFLKIEDLASILQGAEEGIQLLHQRLKDFARSITTSKVSPLDSGETFDTLRLDFNGLPEMVRLNNEAIAVNAGYPSNILFMKQNSGAKATGNNEFTLYHDDVRWYQQTEVAPILRRMHRIFFATEQGREFEKQELFVSFNQLNHSDPAEEATSFFNLTNAYGNLVTHGIADISELRSTLGNLTSHELIEIDPKLTEELQKKANETPPVPPSKEKPTVVSTNTGVKPEQL